MKKKSNLFLFAAPRSGSTQLAQWLNTHPDICLSAIKEPNHFSAHEFDPAYVRKHHLDDVDPARFINSRNANPAQFAVFRDPTHYAALFAHMKTKWRLDASTSYLSCPEAAESVQAYSPTARIIVLTRDPLERACSHYRLAVRTGRTSRTLQSQLAAELSGTLPVAAQFLLRPSFQTKGLKRVTSRFPTEQIQIISFEKMIKSPSSVMSDLAGWLSIDANLFDISLNAQNAGSLPRFMSLNHALEKTGIKTMLRRALPPTVKKKLKRIWLDDTRQIHIPPKHVQMLADALSDSY